MIQKEAWYIEAESISYPKEQLERNFDLRAELWDLHRNDFVNYRQEMREYITTIVSAFPKLWDYLEDLYKKANETWLEWAEVLDLHSKKEIYHRKIHELERQMWTYEDRLAELHFKVIEELLYKKPRSQQLIERDKGECIFRENYPEGQES